MRMLFGLVLILGVGLAGFAAYMFQGYLEQATLERDILLEQRSKLAPTTEILVVSTKKNYGELLKQDDVKAIVWQADSVPEGSFTKIDELFPEGEEPRIILSNMQKFEPILTGKVTQPGEDAGLTSRLGMGMRAFAIKVDVTSGVSGFLRPGDRVDVYWTGKAFDKEVTRLIDTRVRLIAVDQISDSGRLSPVIARNVTVEVSPQQVAALAQAQATGRLSLSLVGAEDDMVAEVVQVDQRSLLGIEERAPAPEPVRERVCSTKVRRGAEVYEQRIPCTN
ncbi:pilus assembly protein CpaB [Roseovarius sp. 22II1-1F6A]|nr:pilus assembly protein CpaB [Roseovarius sp. 22II1-1F6A]